MNQNYEKLLLLFANWIKSQAYKHGTQETYLKIIRNFLLCIDSFGIGELKDVSIELLNNFITTRGGKSYAQANINLRQSALSMFYAWVHSKRYCLTNVMVNYQKSKIRAKAFPKKIKQLGKITVLTSKEQQALLDSSSHGFISIRNKCIIAVIMIGALYGHKVIELTINDLNLEGGYIDCDGRRAPIDLKLYQDICQNWLTVRAANNKTSKSDVLFLTTSARPLSKRALYKGILEFMTMAGVDNMHLGVDILRQTAICNMFIAGKTMEEVRAITGINTFGSLQRYCKCQSG